MSALERDLDLGLEGEFFSFLPLTLLFLLQMFLNVFFFVELNAIFLALQTRHLLHQSVGISVHEPVEVLSLGELEKGLLQSETLFLTERRLGLELG